MFWYNESMNHSITIDTLQFCKTLQEAGFTQKQAEAQVLLMKKQVDEINSIIDDDLATKADLKQLELAMKSDIKRLEVEMKQISYKTIISLGGIVVACTSILGFLIKLH